MIASIFALLLALVIGIASLLGAETGAAEGAIPL